MYITHVIWRVSDCSGDCSDWVAGICHWYQLWCIRPVVPLVRPSREYRPSIDLTRFAFDDVRVCERQDDILSKSDRGQF